MLASLVSRAQPGYADHSGTPYDRANYVKLLEAVRSELDVVGARNNRYYGISAGECS